MLDYRVIWMVKMKLKEEIDLEEKQGYISREAGALLLDYETNKYYEINETGTTIIKLLQKHKTSEEILNTLCEEYTVVREVALRDLDEFLMKLKKYTLIEE
jgi:hypothetical protein